MGQTDVDITPAPAEPRPTIGRTIARGSFWTIVGYGGGQVLRLAGNLVLWRLLFEEAFGVMALVYVMLGALEMFSDIGIGPSIIQNDRSDERFVNTAWTMQIVRGICIFIVACAIAYPIALFYEQPDLVRLVPFVGLTSLINGLNSTNIFAAQRRVDLKRLTLLEMGAQIAATVSMIAWALVHRSVWALAIGGVVGAATKMIGSHVLLPGARNRPLWDRDSAGSLARFGRWIFFSTVLTFIALQSDRLVFGKLVPIALLGVYSVGQTWATLAPSVFGYVVGRVIFPVLSREKNDGGDLPAAFQRVRPTLLLGSGFLTACMMAGGPTLIAFLYDERALEAGWIIQILSVGTWFMMLEAVNGALLLAIGQSRAIALAQGAKVVTMVALIPLGHAFYGFPGAVAGFAAADLFKYAVAAVAAGRAGAPTWRKDLALTALLGVSTLLGLGARELARSVQAPGLVEGILIFVVLVATWGVAFFAHRGFPRRVGRPFPA